MGKHHHPAIKNITFTPTGETAKELDAIRARREADESGTNKQFDEPDDEPVDDPDGCKNPGGRSWVYTGTAYGGDDDSYFGEGRCYCEHCGADGDA
jgi:hypothetical protein